MYSLTRNAWRGLAAVMLSTSCGATLSPALGAQSSLSQPPGAQSSRSSGPAVVQRAPWKWPVPAPWVVARPFEAPATRYASGHRGIDIAVRQGDPILAPVDGTLHFAGFVVDRAALTLEVPGDILVSFEPATTTLAPGAEVAEGSVIGTVSDGGHCDQACLHMGVRLHDEYVSPMLFLGGIPRSVLLPLH
jgi:Peptidase family M23